MARNAPITDIFSPQTNKIVSSKVMMVGPALRILALLMSSFPRKTPPANTLVSRSGMVSKNKNNNQWIKRLAVGKKIDKPADEDTQNAGPQQEKEERRNNMVFGQKFIADMVNCTAADAQLRKADHHDRNNDDGRIKTKPCCPKPACEDNADGQVAECHRQVAAKEAEDIAQVASFCQWPENKKMH